ncbi:MAG TPA: HD-GYP domain-containing protein [Solirubrobacterales bacterium]|nr:HD-GYP domain-containing protein [Solirubrobacterales bacterium]
MARLGTTEPDSDPALQRAILDARAERPRPMLGRELAVGVVVAIAFLLSAGALAVLSDPVRDFDLALAVVLVAAYALACRVEFHMGSVWTDPTQLVFVPMLFLLPTELVPLLVAFGLVLARAPEYLSGAVHPQRVVLRIADSWPAIGPALVLSVAGATSPDAGDAPIYLAAFLAQFTSDVLPQTIRERFGLGIPVRRVLRDSVAVYLVDALLAPVGLLAAFAAANEPATVALILPLLALIQIFAREREARIENALTLSSAYRGTAHLLGELLTTTHEYTGHHSRSVVVLAHQVGEHLGLDEATLRDVEFGALLHDVGKMAVPNEIINKPGKLTDEEWELMKTHTVQGYEMLERIGGVLAEVGAVVRSHHERFDGTGYPDGLAGDEIPIASRVITVCDSFSAMTSHRSYSAAMTIPQAIAELRREAGRQFDPDVVEALIAIVEVWAPYPTVSSNGAPSPALTPA